MQLFSQVSGLTGTDNPISAQGAHLPLRPARFRSLGGLPGLIRRQAHLPLLASRRSVPRRIGHPARSSRPVVYAQLKRATDATRLLRWGWSAQWRELARKQTGGRVVASSGEWPVELERAEICRKSEPRRSRRPSRGERARSPSQPDWSGGERAKSLRDVCGKTKEVMNARLFQMSIKAPSSG